MEFRVRRLGNGLLEVQEKLYKPGLFRSWEFVTEVKTIMEARAALEERIHKRLGNELRETLCTININTLGE